LTGLGQGVPCPLSLFVAAPSLTTPDDAPVAPMAMVSERRASADQPADRARDCSWLSPGKCSDVAFVSTITPVKDATAIAVKIVEWQAHSINQLRQCLQI